MAGKRGANGRFAGAAATETPAADALPPLFDLTVNPVEPTLAADLPPAPELGPAEPGAPDADPALAVALARGIDEAVGMIFGAEYRAEPDQVEAVGEAADPVIRRVLTFVHAGQLAESTVPAPLLELAVLAARVYVAWGDALVATFQRKVSELRAARQEASDGTTAGPVGEHDRGPGGLGRANGHDLSVPGGDPAGAADHQGGDAGGFAGGASSTFARLAAVDTGAGRRRPGRR